MENNSLSVNDVYFGASNSYDGFISYFDRIFNREDYKKIFIIKGGPGTGKSSFMKKMIQAVSKGVKTEAILCSSLTDFHCNL